MQVSSVTATPAHGVEHASTFMSPRNILILVAIAASLAFFAQGYVLFQATMALAYAIALVGLNLLTGYNGQISLGHGAFFATGAYSLAILMNWDVPYWLAIPIAGAISMVAGYAFGRPALKLQGLYLALATFTLSVVLPQLLKYKLFQPWTGGVGGIVLIKPDAPFGLPLSSDQYCYLFTLLITVLMFLIARNLIDSGTGRAIRAIRDHQMAATSMGINHQHYKSMTFGVSAAFAGVGGALSALAVQFVSPDSFTMFLSISLLVGVVVGGIGTLWGAIFGAVFIMFVPELAEKLSKDAAWAVYGVILILLVFAMPKGVMGVINRLRVSILVRN
jgi:branched-chain amino acid transport system permease protein